MKRSNKNIVIAVLVSISACLLIICCALLYFRDDVTIANTPTATTDVSAIIAQTMNASDLQTQSASSPTPPFTVTSLPTLTTFPTQTASITLEPTATIVLILPTNPPAGGGNAVCPCGGDSLNCGDFSTQADAQACMNYCVSVGAGDIHNLDGNADGVACESLP
jgi:hypothetical protein